MSKCGVETWLRSAEHMALNRTGRRFSVDTTLTIVMQVSTLSLVIWKEKQVCVEVEQNMNAG